MTETMVNIGWAIVFSLLGGFLGITLMLLAMAILPKLLDRLTPSLDEEKEIVRGNRAVAEYFGRIVAAGIIGLSLITAAAILGGIIAALH